MTHVRLVTGEERHEVAVRSVAGGSEVRLDGRSHTLVVLGEPPGPLRLEVGGRLRTFHCVRDGDLVHLFWAGVVYRVRIEREGHRPAPRAAAGSLEAPMPGKVIAIKAAPGQAVRKGDELLVIEAMKMENALRAPRDGVVKAVRAAVGDLVNPGAVLVELE
jgi:3-methylcrotonyl-CoA carboxylase alpha subunit